MKSKAVSWLVAGAAIIYMVSQMVKLFLLLTDSTLFA